MTTTAATTSRQQLLDAELELMLKREEVAELRRGLPAEPCDDYVLHDGEKDVRLSELLDPGGRPLVLMQFMYGKANTDLCPMCSMWADGYNGTIEHMEQRFDFAVLVAGDVAHMQDVAAQKGWTNIRFLSASDSTLKADLGFESPEGFQSPGVSVFEMKDGTPHHFYSGNAQIDAEHWRGMDLLSPVWHFMDLTPQGRGDFMPQHSY